MVEVAVYRNGEAVFPFGTPVEALGLGPRLRKRLGEGSYLVHLLPGGALEAFPLREEKVEVVFRHAGRLEGEARREALKGIWRHGSPRAFLRDEASRGVWEAILAEAEKAALPLLKKEAAKRFPVAFLVEPEARAEELDLWRDGEEAWWEGEFVAAARVLVPDYGRPVGVF
ncbi:MAG: hypothetical protein ACP5P8_05705 [Thermus sp.]